MAVHSDAYELGRNDYLRHPDSYHNPFPKSSQDWNDYERGWTQGLKRYPEQKTSYPNPTWKKVVMQSPSKPELSPEQKLVRDAYKKLK
ncbi:hypothetical protein [Zhongshania marina]|uniref:Uncharacterized protein n=1 Tax=Zhongshania marina TaxID=2304603 RepID=A0A2S4HFY2_9GAMM|nr:hypothetical protein [Marortus luteolus]POP52611.1 hypothetical protein C0068_11070 [Marortus luteolus]